MTHFKAQRHRYDRSGLAIAIAKYNQEDLEDNRSLSGSIDETGVAKIMSGLAEVGITGITPDDLHKLPAPSSLEPALTIMADVRAYFQGLSCS